MYNSLFPDYWIWFVICGICFIYTPLGEGWRHMRGSRLVFTLPFFARLFGVTMVLAGPSCLLINQNSGMVGCTLLLSLMSIPCLFMGFGTQEFSVDVQARTWFTRRGVFGIANKKTGRLDDLKGLQMREVPGVACYLYIMRPWDKEKGGFQIGYFISRDRATAASERLSKDLNIPLIPPKKFQAVSGM